MQPITKVFIGIALGAGLASCAADGPDDLRRNVAENGSQAEVQAMLNEEGVELDWSEVASGDLGLLADQVTGDMSFRTVKLQFCYRYKLDLRGREYAFDACPQSIVQVDENGRPITITRQLSNRTISYQRKTSTSTRNSGTCRPVSEFTEMLGETLDRRSFVNERMLNKLNMIFERQWPARGYTFNVAEDTWTTGRITYSKWYIGQVTFADRCDENPWQDPEDDSVVEEEIETDIVPASERHPNIKKKSFSQGDTKSALGKLDNPSRSYSAMYRVGDQYWVTQRSRSSDTAPWGSHRIRRHNLQGQFLGQTNINTISTTQMSKALATDDSLLMVARDEPNKRCRLEVWTAAGVANMRDIPVCGAGNAFVMGIEKIGNRFALSVSKGYGEGIESTTYFFNKDLSGWTASALQNLPGISNQHPNHQSARKTNNGKIWGDSFKGMKNGFEFVAMSSDWNTMVKREVIHAYNRYGTSDLVGFISNAIAGEHFGMAWMMYDVDPNAPRLERQNTLHNERMRFQIRDADGNVVNTIDVNVNGERPYQKLSRMAATDSHFFVAYVDLNNRRLRGVLVDKAGNVVRRQTIATAPAGSMPVDARVVALGNGEFAVSYTFSNDGSNHYWRLGTANIQSFFGRLNAETGELLGAPQRLQTSLESWVAPQIYWDNNQYTLMTQKFEPIPLTLQ